MRVGLAADDLNSAENIEEKNSVQIEFGGILKKKTNSISLKPLENSNLNDLQSTQDTAYSNSKRVLKEHLRILESEILEIVFKTFPSIPCP